MGKVATSPLPSRGSPPLQSTGGGGESEVAHLWAKWLRHPCRLGDPHSCKCGEQKQKWPTSVQSGYVTPAVSGIPTAAQRGGKSEVAHLWAKWLRHPCRLRDPHRCRAEGEIRSGLLVGKVATSPLPSRGSPPLQSGGGNQKWPTCGQSGYVTPAVSGIPTASERGAKSEVAHLWAKWLRHPCRLGDPHRCTAGGGNQKWPTCGQSGYVTPAVSGMPTASERGGKSEVAHLWAKWLRHPCRLGDPHRFRAGGKIRSGPLVGKVATSPLPSRGSPPLQSGGENQKWPNLWARWLHHPCHLGDPHHCIAGGGNQKWPTCGQSGYVTPAVSGIPTAANAGSKRRSGPQVYKVATSPLPSRGSPPLQSGGGNQKWPTCGQSGYVTPAVSGIPTAAQRGGESEVAHLWAKWLRHPCRLRDPHRCRAEGEIRSGLLVGKVATSPLPSRGSPPLQSGGGNQKWPTCGQSGYVTPAVSGIPTASERGAKSEVAHLWAKWLRHPCRLGDPHRCTAGGEIRSGPLVGKVATPPLPSPGSPPLQSGGGNQKGASCGQSGYVTPAVSGIPTAAERGGKSEVAHLWAKWLRHPCHLGDPHHCIAGGGGGIRSGPLVGKVATSPLPSRGSPPLHSGGGKSEVAHLWAKWLRHPCRLGDPHRFKAGGGNQKWPTSVQSGYVTPAVSGIPTAAKRGGGIRSGLLVGKVATSPLPSPGSPPLQSGGGNQKWPTCGQSGYVTPAVSGIPTASERGGEIRSGPLVGKVATSPLPSRGSPPLHSGGGNQKWPTCGQSGYVTPAVSGIPTAAERRGKSEVAYLWAKRLRHPCRLGDPNRFRAGGGNQKWPTCGQSGYVTPAVSGIPTAAKRGGGNQKWPTCGQSGYVTPAVSGIPTASEQGAKSEVAHLWAKWLRHPCRLGDPHRCRAGGGNQKWPTYGQSGYITPAISGIPTTA